jgi:hypothetical protein
MRMEPGLYRLVDAHGKILDFIPRLSESLAGTDDKTSPNSTTYRNHSNVPRLETAVKVVVVGILDGSVRANGGYIDRCCVICLFVMMRARTVRGV